MSRPTTTEPRVTHALTRGEADEWDNDDSNMNSDSSELDPTALPVEPGSP